ncbi:hypothetical protein GIB67_020287 [Kingdonia uniflora]|uniref:GDSL esterase/lipase n=1 Tax=Kingdonia uniflora TaxID=39325 RepID=A0A7J7P3T5_9MAGN|nr:hypothetical protein GIB67_020287 [Kingdonia uniflora]
MLPFSASLLKTCKTPAMAFTLLVLLVVFSIVAHVNLTCNAAVPVLKFPAIFVFGDSTVDPGNNNFIPTAFLANHVPYGRDLPNRVPTGRFTNGRMGSDLLASSLGIKELVPPYLDPALSNEELRTGVSFASAGSGLDDLTTAVSGVIPMSKQPPMFQEYKARLIKVVGETEANRIIGSALVFISIGTNDIVFNYYLSFQRRVEFNISGYQDFLQRQLHDSITVLYDLGCRYFLLPGLGPIGCLPIQIFAKVGIPDGRCLENENADARLYNTKLQELIPRIQASLPGSKLVYAGMYDPMVDILNNPQKYGFLVTNRGCCGFGFAEMGPMCNIASLVCQNASQYVFWDAVHPTEATYSVVAKALADQSHA